FAGLRPLAAPKDANEKTKEISRSHKIIVSDSQLITITGGKWTTYRKMAQDTVNKIIALKKLPPASCKTTGLKIHGANGPIDIANHLYIYGTDKKFIEQLYKEDSSLKELLHPRLPYTKAEVVFAVRNEMARTLEDVLARRVRVLFLDASAAIDIAEEVAQIIGRELKKDTDWEAAQKVIVLADASKFGKKSFAKICGLSTIDEIITDKEISKTFKKKLLENEVKVTVVGR
ncbi:hypothetical protein N8Z58_04215, partial [Flavobacteriaceae bacterium]|nr:hypothetical protein [Flavobacteriaceae bacterium]